MMRQAQGSNNQAVSFGKSRARLFSSNKPTVTFADVAGVDESKEEARRGRRVPEVSRQVPAAWRATARCPVGRTPGTGKTLLAQWHAVAVKPFFSISGSELVEMFVGVGASRARSFRPGG
ncbi:MAG: AAA family ATPase [Thermomicrobiales bacterium]